MANNIPLYTESREYARTRDEIPLWRESLNENIRCKQAIEGAIRQSFDGMHFKPDCVENVIREFGFDRVEYVLGNTLQQLKYDGRFNWSNKEWGENIEIPDDHRNCEFCVGSHPAVLDDGFITEYKKAAEEQSVAFGEMQHR